MKSIAIGSILIFRWLVFINCLAAQEPGIGKYSMVLTDSERRNRKVPVDIYYPSIEAAPDNSTVSPSEMPYPVICFGHGYLISGKWYEDIQNIVVPEGYIMVFPSSEAGLFPSHKKLAEDLNFVVKEIPKLVSDTSFILHGLADTASCLMGHSMGGGSVFIAAAMEGDADAVVGLAPYDTRPSAVESSASVKDPVLIFAGSCDCITPPEKHQIPIYNSSVSTGKTLILIKGGTHCQMGVSHPKCSKGEKMAGCRGTGIDREKQLKIISGYLIPWLDFYLKGDKNSGMSFNSSIVQDESIEFMRSAPLKIE